MTPMLDQRTPAPGVPGPNVSAPNVSAPTAEPERWHDRTVEDVLHDLAASTDGLSEAEALRRRTVHGPNELTERGTTGPLALIWAQLTAVMVLILIGAVALSLALGKYVEAGAIGAIVVLFTLLGFVQEHRAERAIAALRRLSVPVVRTRRDGRVVDVPAGALVPGDLVLLEAGNVVPADLRLVETANLRVQEAALTGESEPVEKHTDPLPRDVALGDRRNLAFSGTQVTYGRGAGVVVATGMATELGRIATLLQGVAADETPLQARLDRVGKQLALVGVVVALVVVGMGALAGESLSDLVLTAISVAVAVIPEGLPAVVTFTLAVGAQRMLRRHALIRRLPAVETLGSVTVICSDKTGTLTQNRMTATVLDVAGHRLDLDAAPDTLPVPARLALAAGVLCNDADAVADPDAADGLHVLGDPTETALLTAAHRAGIDVVDLRARVPRLDERPFDAERKRMSTVHGALAPDAPEPLAMLARDVPVAFVKGALDGLLTVADQVWDGARPEPLTEEWRRRITTAADELAADGLRVLGLAYRVLDEASAGHAEEHLTIVGLVGIIDPPRPEVRDAVATCTRAGIRPVMITGDHPLTAVSIARDLGFGTDGGVITGADLDRLDDEGLRAAVRTTSVFARVSPEHKLRIVQALRAQGEVVAMTGDGVNDAPALKQADIGVAMGITGTDVSKEAADMVLRDDNFATIVNAVEEGRVIYDNLRRFVAFAVAGNLGKILVMLGWPIPFLLAGDVDDAVALLPLQLLWLNLMTDGVLGLSMGLEPAERGVMRRPPHAPGASIWTGGLGRQAVWVGAVIGVAALGVGFAYHAADRPEWQTMVFTSLALMQVFQALGTRSSTESLRSVGLRSNPLMLGAVALVVSLQCAVALTPMRHLLDLEPLGLFDLALCFVLGAVVLVLLETQKAARPRAAAGR